MNSTAENLRMKSENIKKGIANLLTELKKTNSEIDIQMQMNTGLVEEARTNIEQLNRDNAELAFVKTDNEVFIAKVEELLGE